MTSITLRIDDVDFESLLHNMGEWNQVNGRFDRFVVRRDSSGPLNEEFRYVYWFGDPASFILGRSFVHFLGFQYQELSDEAMVGEASFVLTTDYASPSWTRTRTAAP